VSESRLTSTTSILEGVDNPPKVFEISPHDDDGSQLARAPAPASRSDIEALAAESNLPTPPPGLYPAFPHSPTSSDLYFDPSKAV
jgi:hypothetical protein